MTRRAALKGRRTASNDSSETGRSSKWLPRAAEDEGGVAAAEAEGVGEGDVDRAVDRVVWDVAEVAVGIGRVEVDRGRDSLLIDRGEAARASTAAAALSRWPVMLFVELTG